MIFRYIIYIPFILSFVFTQEYADFEIITNNNPYPAKIFIHTQQSNYMAILDESLEPYWYVKSDNIGGIDFKKNKSFISYFNKEESYWVIVDDLMNEVDTLMCSDGYPTDYHDIQITDNGTYIVQAYESIYIDMSTIVDGGNSNALINGVLRIQEINSDNEVIFDWSANDYLSIENYTNLNLTNNEIGWMHGNSIEIDFDLNIIISNRRSSELIKFNRTNGEVLWIFGGPQNQFNIQNDDLNGFSKQHDARRLPNGNILIFDNGNDHSPSLSRVVEYSINEQTKDAYLVWEYRNPYSDISLSMGSSQRLPNGNTLINWGNVHGLGANIIEVDYQKNIVLELSYDIGSAYKVRKSDWIFQIPMMIGDSNLDGTINILDIVYQVNYILLDEDANRLFDLYKIDINKDASIDILDIIDLLNIVLDI